MSTIAQQALSDYQNLQCGNTTTEELGVALPQIYSAELNVKSEKMTAQAVIEVLQDFQAEHGWTLYRDRLSVSPLPPEDVYFIEGEWCKGNQTIKVQLLEGDEYLMTTFNKEAANDNATQCYHDQAVFLRKHSEDQPLQQATYRLWWKCDSQGLWQALAQQFIGITATEEHV